MARLTIDLPSKIAAELAELTKAEERTKIEIIRRAITLYAKLRKLGGDSIFVITLGGQQEISFL